MGHPLPSDLPPRHLAPAPTPDAIVLPVEPDAAPSSTPAVVDGETFVDRIRALTELYQAGMLDDDEFAAAKAVVLRDQTP